MRKDHDTVRPRFLNKKKELISSWCRVSIRQRSEDVGLGALYPAFYAQASGMTHLDMSGLLAQADPNKFDVEVAPSEIYVDMALTMGYHMTLRALGDFNEEAKLKYDDAIETVHNYYMDGLKKKQEAEP